MPADRRSEPSSPAAESTEVEAAPTNRAERRAKGKRGAPPPVVGKITPSHTAQHRGHREYSNRRSG
jgi:hypothetical protein